MLPDGCSAPVDSPSAPSGEPDFLEEQLVVALGSSLFDGSTDAGLSSPVLRPQGRSDEGTDLPEQS